MGTWCLNKKPNCLKWLKRVLEFFKELPTRVQIERGESARQTHWVSLDYLNTRMIFLVFGWTTLWEYLKFIFQHIITVVKILIYLIYNRIK